MPDEQKTTSLVSGTSTNQDWITAFRARTAELCKERRCKPKRNIPQKARLTANHCNDKPPKLRFKPGTFVCQKDKPQLYCIRIAYRLMEDPRVWHYSLEERDSLGSPHTIETHALAAIAGPDAAQQFDACPTLWVPLHSSMDVSQHEQCRDIYHYGSGIHATAQDLINNYEIVSSGEVL